MLGCFPKVEASSEQHRGNQASAELRSASDRSRCDLPHRSASRTCVLTCRLPMQREPNGQDETDGTPNGGEISQCACIAALDVRRLGPTGGAGSHGRRSTQSQSDL